VQPDGRAIRRPLSDRLQTAGLALLAALIVGIVRLAPLRLTPIEEYARSISPPGEAARKTLTRALESEVEYRGADRRAHVFLGDLDSYYWLRLARNVELTGTVCDSTIKGRCWDTMAKAPIGRPNLFPHSLHVYAIAAVHRLISRIIPGYPLEASSYLVPVIGGILGVFPAFAIGWRLGGAPGGFVAALIIGLNPLFLRRSIGGDNDVWNVILPLCIFWSVIKAIESQAAVRQIMYASLAGVIAGVHAGVWSGWIFTYYLMVAGVATAAGLDLIYRCVQEGGASSAPGIMPSHSIRIAVSFSIVAIVATAAITGSLASLQTNPLRQLPGVNRAGGSSGTPSLWVSALTNDAAANIEEAQPLDLAGLTQALGGGIYFTIGILGLLVLLGRALRRSAELREIDTTTVIWFISGAFLALHASRFEIILLPAFAFGVAAALGTGARYLVELKAVFPRCKALIGGLALLIFAALAAEPIRSGYTEAASYIPEMNSAWWNTLSGIRERSPSNAIVVTWGDYGYWVEYVADRRVLADGGSVRSHIPYWLGKALLAPSEAQTVGLLRMLECGSDTGPEGAGARGAFTKLRAGGLSEIDAADTVVMLAGLDRAGARSALIRRGLSAAVADDVLNSTHCAPPPSYLVLTSTMNDIPAWRYTGNWDLHRALAVRAAGEGHGGLKPSALARTLGVSEANAQTLIDEARALKSPAAAQNFIAPSDGYLSPRWLACFATGATMMECPMEEIHGVTIAGNATLQAVEFERGSAQPMLRITMDHQGATHWQRAAPGSWLIARDGHLNEVSINKSAYPDMAVLLDADRSRALVGPSYLVDSTFTRLMFLDGRYSRYFEKVDEEWGYADECVTTWRINWDPHTTNPSG
jgi:hypothetical protein